MQIQRMATFLKRMAAARRLGFFFPGMSRLSMPTKIRLCGMEMALHYPPGDDALSLDLVNVIMDDKYRLREIGTPPETILDVGSNIGLFTMWAHHVFPHVQIHSYEPAALTFASLERNTGSLDNVMLFHEGISSTSGRSRLQATESSRINRIALDPAGDIAVKSLDEAIGRLGGRCDLLKLDCEGFEWEIFTRSEPFRRVSRIHMEYHLTDGRDLADLHMAANRIGFKIEAIVTNQGFGMAFLCRKELV